MTLSDLIITLYCMYFFINIIASIILHENSLNSKPFDDEDENLKITDYINAFIELASRSGTE
jgi:hypothetical protein